jgi:cardiolipin synthase
MPDHQPQADTVFTSANIVTFLRLCAVPAAFWLVVEHRMTEAFVLFVLAGLSDAVDGWLARRYGGNAIGAILDPLADKSLLVTMYVTLAVVAAIPVWVATLVVFRDLLIVGGVLALRLTGQSVTIRPLFISKLNTVFQILLIAVTLFLAGFELSAPLIVTALVWIVGTLTIASGAAYVWGAARA